MINLSNISEPTEKFIDHLQREQYYCRLVKSSLGFIIYYMDFSKLKLRLSDRTPVVKVPSNAVVSSSPEKVYKLIIDLIAQNRFDSRIPILILEDKASILHKFLLDSPYSRKLVILDNAGIEKIIEASSLTDRFLSIIRSQIPLVILSPYEVTSAVTGSQFFGRDIEIKKIINHPDTNYIVVGSRRLGKTSLLKEVKYRLEDQQDNAAGENESYSLAQTYNFFDCLAYNNGREFLMDFITTLDPREYNRLERVDPISYFPVFLRKLYKKKKEKLVFFLDEVDNLLRFDRFNNYEIVRLFLSGSNNGYCRLILGGFREAIEEMRGIDSPLFAKLEPIYLEPFNINEVRPLVLMPMNNLGIKILNSDDFIKVIVKDTGGHPNFVQHVCQALIKRLDTEHKIELDQEMLKKIWDDEVFRERVAGVFVSNTNEIEKAIVYAVGDTEDFTLEIVNHELEKLHLDIDIKSLDESLSFLIYLGVIRHHESCFHFNTLLLPKLVRERYSDRLIQDKVHNYLLNKSLRR